MKKAERLNQELIFLRHRNRFQLNDLIENFKISKRTALRDIVDLEALGLPMYHEAGRYGYYQVISQKFLTPIQFNEAEIQAVFFAVNAMQSLSDTPFNRNYQRIREKLLAELSENQRVQVEKVSKHIYFYDTAPITTVPHLDVLMQSLLAETTVQLVYGKDDQRMFLQLFDLFYRQGVWFCNAQNITTGQFGTYRCDLMRDVIMQNQPQQRYTLTELQQLYEVYEATHHQTVFRCVVTERGKEHFLRNHYPNMTLVREEESWIITGGYHADELAYMAQYILGFGENIQIVYPAELRQTTVALLERIMQQL